MKKGSDDLNRILTILSALIVVAMALLNIFHVHLGFDHWYVGSILVIVLQSYVITSQKRKIKSLEANQKDANPI